MGWAIYTHGFIQYKATCSEKGCEDVIFDVRDTDRQAQDDVDAHWAYHDRLWKKQNEEWEKYPHGKPKKKKRKKKGKKGKKHNDD